ncbi:MAG: NERD domain-containing protein [Bacillus sp. (in: Bacteria)]|nr:NERD domain-containing protein [Bacillus sp. (in: firmicutes)]
MALEPRSESTELLIMRSLNTRMDLSPKEKKYYFNLEKGYEGEVMFDQLTETVQSDMLIINDLCLESNNSVFQIDTLIISQETIYPIEVKNYAGDYRYDSEGFHTLSGNDINNPLDQVKRCNSLLRQLLQSHGYNFPVETYLVFINPEFTLYQAPLNPQIIFPTQLNRFIKKLNMTPSKLNGQHKKLADLLISLHLDESPYTRLPRYDYEQVKKGIVCSPCNSFMIADGEKKVVCAKCGYEERVESAVLRSVKELKLLFPDLKITTSGVHEWCKVVESKKMIRRILMDNYTSIGKRHLRFFE